MTEVFCSDCPPADYPTDETRCATCPLRTFFVLDFHRDEAALCASEYLDDEGIIKDGHNGKIFWVNRGRVIAEQDGVFVRRESIDGETFYRQVA